MNELSRRMMVTGGNVTGITDQLVTEGLVERAVEGDRRAYRVRLTARGPQAVPRHGRMPTSLDRDRLRWPERARSVRTLHKLLGKVKQHSQNTTEAA
jgi:DNA-binding MarR family transcriptional regulator